MNFSALLGPSSDPKGTQRHRESGRAAYGLWLALLMALSPQTVSARAFDDPLVTVNVFRGALLDGNVGTALTMLAPDVLVYQGGSEEGTLPDYARNRIKKDIAHLAAYYVDERSQKHDVQDNLAWVSTRLRLLGKSTEKPEEYFGTETVVLRRSASGWLIVHRHWSDSALADDGG